MKPLVVLPTYNEAGNIGNILRQLSALGDLGVIVVDDNSADGTADRVRDWAASAPGVNLITRPEKLGLGTAYIEGFKWGLQRDYDLFFEMDADNSHNPSAIPYFIEKAREGYDLVVGSRYLNNTISVVGWDFRRLLLSKFGNFYASTLLGLRRFSDLTSGFRCYTRRALEAVDLDLIRSNGYAFQIEMLFGVHRAGLPIAEIPIIFYERNGGSSKMSRRIIREAALCPFRIRLDAVTERVWNVRKDRKSS